MREKIMSSSAKAAGTALLLCALLASAADGPTTLTTEQVKELQAKYAAERAEADKEGLTKLFSPDWYARAEAFAKKGEAALAAGRLAEGARHSSAPAGSCPPRRPACPRRSAASSATASCATATRFSPWPTAPTGPSWPAAAATGR